MQDDPSQFGGQPTQATNPIPSQSQADKEWQELQRDLDVLGRQLAELSTHTASLGEHFLSSLQARFEEVRVRAYAYKQTTESQIEQARRETESSFNEARVRSTEAAKEAARQVWEKSQPLREGAKDVGDGLARAWTELRASFGRAAQRLHTEGAPQNGTTAPVQTDDHRERS